MQLTLTIRTASGSPADNLQARTFDQFPVIIGRSTSCHFVLNDPSLYVSSNHAVVIEDQGQLLVEDTSSNGVYINSANDPIGRGQTSTLRDGDTIAIGDYSIVVRIDHHGSADDAFGTIEQPKQETASEYNPFEDSGFDWSKDDDNQPGWEKDEKQDPQSNWHDWTSLNTGSSQQAAQSNDAPQNKNTHDDLDWDDFPSDTPAQEKQPLRASPSQPTKHNLPDPHAASRNPAPPGGSPRANVDPRNNPYPGSLQDSRNERQYDQRNNPHPDSRYEPHNNHRNNPRFDANNHPGNDPRNPPYNNQGYNPRNEPRNDDRHNPRNDPRYDFGHQRQSAAAPNRDAVQPQYRQASTPPAHHHAQAASALSAFYKAAKLQEADFQNQSPEELMTQTGKLLNLSIDGMMMLLQSRAEMKNAIRSDVTQLSRRDNNPLKFSYSSQDALQKLLTDKNGGDGYQDAERAIMQAVDDLKIHQVALLEGMKAAVKALLVEFNPEKLGKTLEKNHPIAANIPITREAKLWQLFEEHYDDIHEDTVNNFNDVFGHEFRKAYERMINRHE